MGALAEAGQRDGVHAVPLLLQECAYPLPAPAAVPGAMHKDKIGHQITSLCFRSDSCAPE